MTYINVNNGAEFEVYGVDNDYVYGTLSGGQKFKIRSLEFLNNYLPELDYDKNFHLRNSVNPDREIMNLDFQFLINMSIEIGEDWKEGIDPLNHYEMDMLIHQYFNTKDKSLLPLVGALAMREFWRVRHESIS